jgi:type II secretion system protein J
MRANSQPNRESAFTLIEILLAVGIFSIVLFAINTVFFSALRLRAATTRLVDEAAPRQQALAVMRRDLQGALPPGGPLTGDFKSSSGGMGLGMAQYGGLEFATSTGILKADVPWGDVQRVSYQLRDAGNRATGGKDLYRSVTRNLLSTMVPETDDRWLMGEVETLEFLFYDGANWRNSWDTSLGDTNLPSAVRVRIQLADPSGVSAPNRRPLEMVVPLTVQSATNQVQATDDSQAQ